MLSTMFTLPPKVVERAIHRPGLAVLFGRPLSHTSLRSLAERMGVSISAVRSKKKDGLSVPIHFHAWLQVFGDVEASENLVCIVNGDFGLPLEEEQLLKRIRS
jgi:hypothetical protein